MTHELQSTHEASGIDWAAMRNHIPCMAYVIQLTLGEFMSWLSVKGLTKSWEANERDEKFRENESTDIGKTPRPRKGTNDRIS